MIVETGEQLGALPADVFGGLALRGGRAARRRGCRVGRRSSQLGPPSARHACAARGRSVGSAGSAASRTNSRRGRDRAHAFLHETLESERVGVAAGRVKRIAGLQQAEEAARPGPPSRLRPETRRLNLSVCGRDRGHGWAGCPRAEAPGAKDGRGRAERDLEAFEELAHGGLVGGEQAGRLRREFEVQIADRPADAGGGGGRDVEGNLDDGLLRIGG
jgi:hypothetical protein